MTHKHTTVIKCVNEKKKTCSLSLLPKISEGFPLTMTGSFDPTAIIIIPMFLDIQLVKRKK